MSMVGREIAGQVQQERFKFDIRKVSHGKHTEILEKLSSSPEVLQLD